MTRQDRWRMKMKREGRCQSCGKRKDRKAIERVHCSVCNKARVARAAVKRQAMRIE
jgi:hypothetical protein